MVASLRQLGSASTRRLVGFGSTKKTHRHSDTVCNVIKRKEKVASAFEDIHVSAAPLGFEGKERYHLHICTSAHLHIRTSAHDLHISNQ